MPKPESYRHNRDNKCEALGDEEHVLRDLAPHEPSRTLLAQFDVGVALRLAVACRVAGGPCRLDRPQLIIKSLRNMGAGD